MQVYGKDKYYRERFVNLLNIEVGYDIAPQGFMFSDLGCWHGFGFNNSSDLAKAGGFRGPAFLGEKSLGLQWLSDSFEKLSLMEVKHEAKKELHFSKIKAYEYLPGMLKQELEADDLSIQMKEIAISDRSTMTEYTIVNNGKNVKEIYPSLSGVLSYKAGELSKESNDCLVVGVHGNKHYFAISFPSNWGLEVKGEDAYRASSSKIKLDVGKSYTFQTFTTYSPSTTKEQTLAIHKSIKKNRAKSYLKDNSKRWNTYINDILQHDTPYLKVERNRDWAIKALMTLNTNWRSAAGDIMHAGIQPSTGHFNGFWAWDSWIHAVGASVFNRELAKDQMRTMFDYQTPEGMIVDLISLDKNENNNLCSKPPIAGWATYMVYQTDKDKSFVKEMLPKLIKYHKWRYKYRDHNQNGLCEYGGIGSEEYMGQWESGMDVAVKFDGVKMIKNAEGAYSFNQESIELNSYLCAEKFYLAYLLDEIGQKHSANQFREEGKQLKKLIQENFFDKETGFFYDRKSETGELVKVIDISGWIPLFTKVASPDQARAVKNNMLDPELFGDYFPFSSLNHKHPLYKPDEGYFRGQTWMNYTYFGIRGWKNYGFTEDAYKYTMLIPDKLKGLADKGFPIRENWNSETGEGMTAMHFGWSSVFSILLLTEDTNSFSYVPYIDNY